jgi:effector-binding domain-containing protein
MAYQVKLQEIEPRMAAALRFQTDVPGIARLFGPALGRIFGLIGRSGAECTGPPLALYHKVDDEGVDMEVAVPIAGALPEEGPDGVHLIELPCGPAAVTRHVGPYEECGAAYEAIDMWMHENGHQPRPPMWEVYLTDPNEEPDSQKWVTEIYFPVQ